MKIDKLFKLAAYEKPTDLKAPALIEFTTRAPWTAKDGTNGVHVCVVVMKLDREEASGPQYVRTEVLRDEDAPPASFRASPPTAMGVAWFALNDQIANGQIKVLS